MQLVSFNLFRSPDIPGVHYIKPAEMYAQKALIEQADWLLFPETWQVNALVHAFRQRIFPSPASYHLGADKVQMTRSFWAVCPEHIPCTRIEANDARGSESVRGQGDPPFHGTRGTPDLQCHRLAALCRGQRHPVRTDTAPHRARSARRRHRPACRGRLLAPTPGLGFPYQCGARRRRFTVISRD